MEDWAKLIAALVPLSWPIILIIVLWKLFPAITNIVNSRSFSVKMAGFEWSVQDATEKLDARIDDLQKQVISLKEQMAAPALSEGESHLKPAALGGPRTVLWVDDNPRNNAFEIAQLKDWGANVVTCTSTGEALETVQKYPDVSVVISDMGRREGAEYNGKAGLDLLHSLRGMKVDVPFIVYSSAKYVDRNNQAITEAGGSGATSSQVELLQWLKQRLGLTAV